MKTSLCRSCSAPIIWAVTPAGKRIPIDAASREDGNIILRGAAPRAAPVAYVISDANAYVREALERGDSRWVSHFATCAQAGKWRKK